MRADRLMTVARVLREIPEDGYFEMSDVVTPCGAPACAFGHYAARTDVQDEFRIEKRVNEHGGVGWADIVSAKTGERVHVPGDYLIFEHFGIDRGAACALFGAMGCDGARTPRQAAEFIELFVAESKQSKAT